MSLTTLLSQKKQEVQNVDKLLSFVYPRQLLSKEVQMKVDDIAKKCIIGSEVKVDRDDDQKSGHAALADNLSQLSGSPASNYVPNAKHESLLRGMSSMEHAFESSVENFEPSVKLSLDFFPIFKFSFSKYILDTFL